MAENALHLRSIEQLGKTVEFNRELDPSLPMVRGDAVQLTDVCLQIIGNAADMLAEKGGVVSVKSYVDKATVVLEITDNGPGIADPTRVFDPFYTTKALGKGTGLGLSVCYGIIADHKGEIVAENIDGGGARFKVRLPIAHSANPGASQPAKSAQES